MFPASVSSANLGKTRDERNIFNVETIKVVPNNIVKMTVGISLQIYLHQQHQKMYPHVTNISYSLQLAI